MAGITLLDTAEADIPTPSTGKLTFFMDGTEVKVKDDGGTVYTVSGITDGDKGNITVSASGATWTIDAGVVTLAMQANIATARLIGRTTAGTGVPEAVPIVGSIGSPGVDTNIPTEKAVRDALTVASSIPQNSQSTAYTTVLGDAGKHILHPTADNNARTFTIDSNANVAYPIGTAITFVNQINTVTIAITSDTLTLAGAGTTGSRTLAANGMATALKIGTTDWIINGTGLT